MKKIVKLLSVLFLAMVVLTSCSSNAAEKDVLVGTMKSEDYTITISYDGIKSKDVLTQLNQVSVIDLSSQSDEVIKSLEEAAKQYASSYEQIPGAKYTFEIKDKIMTETVVIPLKGDSLKKAIELGLLPVTDQNAQIISLQQTEQYMRDSGYEVKVK